MCDAISFVKKEFFMQLIYIMASEVCSISKICVMHVAEHHSSLSPSGMR
jgi:hypothetical protein